VSDVLFSFAVVALYAGVVFAASMSRRPMKREPEKNTPWFDELEHELTRQKLRASVVVDVTPMTVRVRLKRHVAALEDVLGSRPEPKVALALARIRKHGAIAIEDDELVTVLARNLVDAWDARGHVAYANDIVTLVDALTKAKTKTKVRAPPPTEPLPPLVDEDSPEPQGEGAPSGAPVAVRFQK
jgi:hypothetical protein